MSSAITGTRAAAHSPFSVLLTTSLVSSLIMLDSNIVAIACQRLAGRFQRASQTFSGSSAHISSPTLPCCWLSATTLTCTAARRPC